MAYFGSGIQSEKAMQAQMRVAARALLRDDHLGSAVDVQSCVLPKGDGERNGVVDGYLNRIPDIVARVRCSIDAAFVGS
jgi:hypothetical protein